MHQILSLKLFMGCVSVWKITVDHCFMHVIHCFETMCMSYSLDLKIYFLVRNKRSNEFRS
jgi:hypothetical protein